MYKSYSFLYSLFCPTSALSLIGVRTAPMKIGSLHKYLQVVALKREAENLLNHICIVLL